MPRTKKKDDDFFVKYGLRQKKAQEEAPGDAEEAIKEAIKDKQTQLELQRSFSYGTSSFKSRVRQKTKLDFLSNVNKEFYGQLYIISKYSGVRLKRSGDVSEAPTPHQQTQRKISFSAYRQREYRTSVRRLSSGSKTKGEKSNLWIRRIALDVLVFECIQQSVFEYDYSPILVNIADELVYVNQSQEAGQDLSLYGQYGLINTVLLTTHSCSESSALGLTSDGLEFLFHYEDKFEKIRKRIDSVLHRKENGRVCESEDENFNNSILVTKFVREEGHFLIYNQLGLSYISDVTFSEDVSYISSPRFFACLTRNLDKVSAFDNGKMAKERASASTSTMKIKVDETVFLSDVTMFISEWMPFGRNHVGNCVKRLLLESNGSGGLFSDQTDTNPSDTVIEHGVDNIGNCIQVIDHVEGKYLNFVAEVFLAEAESIRQVEDFGVHINFDGNVLYGLKIESIMGGDESAISLDLLSRVIVDVHQDTAFIASNLMTKYQRVMTDSLYGCISENRPKFTMLQCRAAKNIKIRAVDVNPSCSGKVKNEFCQVVGPILKAIDLKEDCLLVIGRKGAIIVGSIGDSNDAQCPMQQSIMQYVNVQAKVQAVESFVSRLYGLGDHLGRLRDRVIRFDEDPTFVSTIELMESEAQHELINLFEVHSHLQESSTFLTDNISGSRQSTPRFDSLLCRDLRENLAVEETLVDIKHRIEDLKIALNASENELKGIRQMTLYISNQQASRMQQHLHTNTKNLEKMFCSNERSSSSLEIMQIILAGSLAFDIMDRLSTAYVSDSDYSDWFRQIFIDPPLVWFSINVFFWLCMIVGLIQFMSYLSNNFNGVTAVRLVMNRRYNPLMVESMLESKDVTLIDRESIEEGLTTIQTVKINDSNAIWGNNKVVRVEFELDVDNRFLLRAFISKKSRQRVGDNSLLKAKLSDRLEDAKVVRKRSKVVKPESYYFKSFSHLNDNRSSSPLRDKVRTEKTVTEANTED